MAVTYLDTLLTDRDKLRLNIGDTVENSGPKPNGGNFSDNEIAFILTDEGSVGRATARCYEILSTIWAHYADTKIDPRDEKLSQISKQYMAWAKEKRAQYGYSTSTISSGFVTRVDGNSDDIDSGEVDSTFYIDRWWE